MQFPFLNICITLGMIGLIAKWQRALLPDLRKREWISRMKWRETQKDRTEVLPLQYVFESRTHSWGRWYTFSRHEEHSFCLDQKHLFIPWVLLLKFLSPWRYGQRETRERKTGKSFKSRVTSSFPDIFKVSSSVLCYDDCIPFPFCSLFVRPSPWTSFSGIKEWMKESK
jgi:hypothetical protein